MTDPNVSMCPSDHPFIQTVPLEQEAMTLLQGIMTLFYSSSFVLSLYPIDLL
jgi:symplekin